MSRATYPLKLPASIKAAAARLAKEDGVSLNQWIAVAVAQKIGVVETAAEFFARRAEGHSVDGLKRALAKVPDGPPEPGDELPEGWPKPAAKRTAVRSGAGKTARR
jgi:hypothetical protein